MRGLVHSPKLPPSPRVGWGRGATRLQPLGSFQSRISTRPHLPSVDGWRHAAPGRCIHHGLREVPPIRRAGELPLPGLRAVLFSGRPDRAGCREVCGRDHGGLKYADQGIYSTSRSLYALAYGFVRRSAWRRTTGSRSPGSGRGPLDRPPEGGLTGGVGVGSRRRGLVRPVDKGGLAHVQQFSDRGEEAARPSAEAHVADRSEPRTDRPRGLLRRQVAGPVGPHPEERHAKAEVDLLMGSYSIWHWIVVILLIFGVYWFFRSLIRVWHRERRKGDG